MGEDYYAWDQEEIESEDRQRVSVTDICRHVSAGGRNG